MTNGLKPPLSLQIARGFSTVAAGIPLVTGIWLLLYCYLRPPQRPLTGPGWGDMDGAFALIGGVIALGWSFPLIFAARAVWHRRLSGCVTMAALCGCQGLLQAVLLRLGGQIWQSPIWLSYTLFLFIVLISGVMAAARLPGNQSATFGFPVLPPSVKPTDGEIENNAEAS